PKMGLELNDKLFSVAPDDFEALALELFCFQYGNNPLYREFADLTGKSPGNVRSLVEIPFLPIRFFKSHRVVTGSFSPEDFFESSGTTGPLTSRHFIKDMSLYRRSFTEGFRLFYGG